MRKYKEVMGQLEMDKVNQQKQSSIIDRLTVRLNSYKRQADESEEMAAENLSKFQKARSQLQDVQHQIDQSESAELKTRVYNRSSISCTRASVANDYFLRERSYARERSTTRGLSKSGSSFNVNRLWVLSRMNCVLFFLFINPIFRFHAHVHDHFECQYLFK